MMAFLQSSTSDSQEKPPKVTLKTALREAFCTTTPGDSKPSRSPMCWPRQGKHKEFPASATGPQQDHRRSGLGVKIAKPKDIRATPHTNVVRANVHKKPIFTVPLPPRDASVKTVREYLYLVLTCLRISAVADKTPHWVTWFLISWNDDGEALRNMDLKFKGWNSMLPVNCMDVYGKIWTPSQADSKAIGDHLRAVIAPLVGAERKLELIAAMDESDDEFDDRKAANKRNKMANRVAKWISNHFSAGMCGDYATKKAYMVKISQPLCQQKASVA
ncbi:hypothetical protein EJ08DRAFT_681257 [Tothia fuscella]|uniref:Uncharacterized protein n=1 Tax=Tothia fuscella TaxID=1048955 RepID=A0A9P4NLU5_9PEZI|nr:hypothetical protein EJ08DRAFT_681257 [Tothia fuscella]